MGNRIEEIGKRIEVGGQRRAGEKVGRCEDRGAGEKVRRREGEKERRREG